MIPEDAGPRKVKYIDSEGWHTAMVYENTPNPAIPAEAVEAAAKWLHDNDCRSALHSGFPADIECYGWIEEATELLEAAAPHLMAEAWDEAIKTADAVAWEHDASAASAVRAIPNPYRK